jgi:hypothetical protein
MPIHGSVLIKIVGDKFYKLPYPCFPTSRWFRCQLGKGLIVGQFTLGFFNYNKDLEMPTVVHANTKLLKQMPCRF